MATPNPDSTTLERILAGIPEGRNTAIAYARQLALKDDRYKEFVRALDGDRKQDLGLLCNQHEIAPQDFLADINREAFPVIEEAMKFARGIAQGIVAERLPKVVHRGMIEGAKADGVTDRHFTLQKEGFHVTPKGTNINVNQQQINQQAAGLPVFEDQTNELAQILKDDEPLQLEAGEDFIDADTEVENDLREEQLA